MANLAYFLEALAVVESADRHPGRVAVLLGAAGSLRATVGANVYAYYRSDASLRDEAELGARAALGTSAYDEAVEAGTAMDVASVIRFALDDTV